MLWFKIYEEIREISLKKYTAKCPHRFDIDTGFLSNRYFSKKLFQNYLAKPTHVRIFSKIKICKFETQIVNIYD